MAVAIGANAACPPLQAHGWRARIADEETKLHDEAGERALYLLALEHWNAAVARAARRVEADAFARWAFLMYDKIEPLRGAPHWRRAAGALIRESAVELS
jgi:hypothetical protein